MQPARNFARASPTTSISPTFVHWHAHCILGMAFVLMIGLVGGYAWSVVSLHRQARHGLPARTATAQRKLGVVTPLARPTNHVGMHSRA